MKDYCLRRTVGSLLILLCLAFAEPGSAQTTTATISGTVNDETKALLAGVSISVKNLDTGIVRVAATDSEGRYRIALLTPAQYEVQAAANGFQTAIRTGIELTIGREAHVDFTLSVGEVSARVLVAGEASLVETTDPSIGALVDDKKIRDLPLNGRSYDQLVLLQPGISFYPNAANDLQFGAGAKFTAFGARPQANLFLIDGTDINDQADFTPGSAAGLTLGVETLREFKVLSSSYGAEYGRKSGAVVVAVTQSGTNDIHGDVFHFLRNDNLDARNFFDKKRPEFKRNQFGGTFGAPIIRNKAFIFSGYEGLREVLGLSAVTVVPSASVHKGCLPDASAPNGLRCIGVNPKIQPYLDLLPLPNGADHGDGTADFFSNPVKDTKEDNFTVRVDYEFNKRDSFFARYTYDDAQVTLPDAIPTFGQNFKSRYQYLTLSEQRVISPNMVNVLRFGFNRSYSDSKSFQTIGETPELAFVPGQTMVGNWVIESTATSAFDGGYGPVSALPRTFAYNLFQYSDDLTYTRGRHFLKFGGSFSRNQLNAKELAFIPRGTYSFRTMETFLRAQPFLFRAEAPGSDTQRAWRQNIFGFYVQDDWAVSSRLRLNLGLRYEFVTIPHEIHGKSSTLVNLTDKDPTVGPLWQRNPSLMDFAPRVGFAWDVSGNGKTSVRGGFGIYYDLPISYFYSIQGSRTFPFHFTGTVANPPFPNALDGLFTPSARSLVTFDKNLSTPTKLQYNLSVQREIQSGTVVSFGYVGSRGYHLLRHREADHFIPTILPDGTRFYPAGAPKINPNFNSIRMATTDVNSYYNGLYAGVLRRFQGGLQFQASYTLSKSTDNNSGAWGTDIRNQESFVEDPLDANADYALSGFDARHVVTFNFTYDIPVAARFTGFTRNVLDGWQINGITTLSSGQPFTVVWSGNRGRTYPGSTRSRPNLRAGANGNPVLGGPDLYFDPTVFEPQPAGFTGNAPRNSIIGPGLANTDFSLVKSINFGEGRLLQFRSEVFNIFNRANFGIPLRVLFDTQGKRIASAGQIKNTITPSRQVQFGLKLTF
ncbi:MAG TPA: TonB-dependent receptor [Pyrinomonadaceae bacterium]|nr:TonB-dependent receptor [Pyrinomonadaceae bacterium]